MTEQMENFIFDIDGTLIDTFDMYMPPMIKLLCEHGYPVAPKDEQAVMRKLFGITGADALRIYGVKEEDVAPMVKEWFQLSYQREDRVTVLDGIPAVLQGLNAAGRNLAVATSKVQDEYEHFRQEFSFAKLFDVAITEKDTVKHKPDPDPILAAMKKMGITDPARTVYVGDTINDLKAAKAAGVKSAAALYGSANPASIMGADFLLHEPADLLKI